MRKTNPVVASTMDGVNDNVKEVFNDKYEKLYNSTEDGAAILLVQEDIESKISVASIDDVQKVKPDIVKEAAHKLKPGKGDPVYSFSSDCFNNARYPLYEKLSLIIKGFLVHGHVTLVLLLATLVPIKINLGV
jgi:hypothetical protein